MAAALLCLLSLTSARSSADERATDDASPASSATRPRLHIGRTTTPPTLDGRIDASEWANAGVIDGLTQANPVPGGEPLFHTRVFVLTDGETLFIAARLEDDAPEQIVRQRMLRDDEFFFDDRFNFAIDPFLDRQNGYFFQVNPNGGRRDALIEGDDFVLSWDTRWFVATSIDAEGWSVEIALPFSSFPFDPDADVWGFNVERGIRRNNETDRWSDPVLERFVTTTGTAGDLEGMRIPRQGLGLRVVPSGVFSHREDEVGDDRRTRFEPTFEAYYQATPSVVGSVTVNTDFSDVEADSRQLNLTRFDLFFPELRDFFLQDAGIFNFGAIAENGRPFFSRRIGLGADGRVRNLLAGGKVTGRVGPVKFGVLDVVMDQRERVDQTNLFVARTAMNVLDESLVGAILTHGDPDADGRNTVLGLDGVFRSSRFLGNRNFRASFFGQLSWSDPDSILVPDPEAATPIDGQGHAYGFSIGFPNDRYQWTLGLVEIGDEFDPALGFVNRRGIRTVSGDFRFRRRPGWRGVRTLDHQLAGELVTEANATHTVRSAAATVTVLEWTNDIDDAIAFEYVHRYEFVSTPFASIEIPPGEFHFDEGRLRVETSRNRPLRAEFEVGYGTFFDGTRTRFTLDVEGRPARFLLLGGEYEMNDVRLPGSRSGAGDDLDRDRLLHVVRGRIDFFFTPEIAWRSLVQYDSASDGLGVNSRLRWIVEDGREVFVVVNQGADLAGDPRRTTTELVAKVEWTLRF